MTGEAPSGKLLPALSPGGAGNQQGGDREAYQEQKGKGYNEALGSNDRLPSPVATLLVKGITYKEASPLGTKRL